MTAAIEAAQPEGAALAEGSNYNVSNPDCPMRRTVVVNIRSSLSDLCLQKSKGVWAPSGEALKNIFQQKKFVSLDGSSEAQGDLKSVVLHDMRILHSKSSFPLALGARISGVDDKTFSGTGEAFSTIILPMSESSTSKSLQADDTSLAYEFAKVCRRPPPAARRPPPAASHPCRCARRSFRATPRRT
jgi:hypothetical protein